MVVVTDVNVEEGENTVREIGGDAVFVQQDVRDEDQWRQLVAMVLDRFGRLDVLVNNAGVIRLDDIETATLEDWRFVTSVNVEGTFLGCKHAIPAMRAGGGGSIVNVSSTAAILGFPVALPTRRRRGPCRPSPVPSPAHCLRPRRPHPVQRRLPAPARVADGAVGQPPGGDRMASPFAVANAVVFLASDESATSTARSSTSTAAPRRWCPRRLCPARSSPTPRSARYQSPSNQLSSAPGRPGPCPGRVR